MGKKILIVEDDKSISTILNVNLRMAGYEPEQAFDGEEGLKKALNGEYDLILLDIMLPYRDGFSICKRVREQGLNTPIIMVTAKADELDKVLGLDLGADDYVTKPFSIKEVLARVKANIRRVQGETVINKKEENSQTIVVRDLKIDTKTYSVQKGDKFLDLSTKEYEVLLHLATHLDEVFSRENLLSDVWGYDGFYGDMRTVDVTMARLRSKIEDDTQNPCYIKTIRGKGYFMPK